MEKVLIASSWIKAPTNADKNNYFFVGLQPITADHTRFRLVANYYGPFKNTMDAARKDLTLIQREEMQRQIHKQQAKQCSTKTG